MSFDVIDNWHKELDVMNHNKRGRKFDYPDSFMKLLGYARAYFGLPYRQAGRGGKMIRAYTPDVFPKFLISHQSTGE